MWASGANRVSGRYPGVVDGGSGPVGYHRELVDRLAELRAGSGNPSYREIARRTPTSAGHISDVLNGRKVPSGDMAASIGKALGADQNTQKRLRWYADRALADRVRPVRGDTDVTAQPVAVPVRSAYLEQVRRTAPPRLVGRDDELHQLDRFCTAPHGEQYVWWRAAAWAGKSALMSWFVLHPPPRTRVVSFFVTARYAGQSDRTAFADVLMEQLAQLLRRPMPTFLTPATRDAHLLGMLGDAARACQERGQRLVLVVDGLDEDRGVVMGPDAYSIAAVLPGRPAGGMRVIVAGRPNPPVPADVPDDHPLRDPGIVRVLDESPHAKVIRTDAERELDRLLDGTPAEQDLLGLLTAAGGGLSGADLAELTGWSPRQVDRQLHTVAGRTFARRATGWRDGTGPEVYLLGHEELRNSAIRFLGAARLDGYRERLHTWADHYRDQGWPKQTPEYLLRGYHRMLHDAGDLPRMVDCATDQARHHRMLELTGGDTTALTEIAATMDAIRTQPTPDLKIMGRLAVHRDHLAERNTNIPTDLPAVWAALGQPTRAEALARAITNPQRRDRALSGVVKAVAGRGDRTRAQILAGSIADPEEQQRAYVWIVLAEQRVSGRPEAHPWEDRPSDEDQAWALQWAMIRIHEQRETSVESGTAPDTDDLGWAWALRRADEEEDDERAETGVWGQADPDAYDVAWMNPYAVYEDGDQDESIAWDDPDPDDPDQAWVSGWATPEAPARDEFMPWADTDPTEEDQAWVLRWAVTREHERAETSLGSSTDTDTNDLGWAWAMEQTRVGEEDEGPEADIGPDEPDQAWALGWDADDLWAATGGNRRVCTLIFRARAAAWAGDHHQVAEWTNQAETVSEGITDPDLQARALSDVARFVAGQGDHDRAEALARRIIDPHRQAAVFSVLARVAAGRGDRDRAAVLADRAETVARSINNPQQQTRELTSLLKAVTGANDRDRGAAVLDRAAALTRRITDPYEQALELITLATVIADAGDHSRATELANQAEIPARSTIHTWWQRHVLADMVVGLAKLGDRHRAKALFLAIGDPNYQAWALIGLARLGDHQWAEALVPAIGDPGHQAEALVDLAELAARAGRRDRAAVLVDQAERLAGSTGWYDGSTVLAKLAPVVADLGDHDRAETLARRITGLHRQARAFIALARAAAGRGDHDRAAALVDHAERAARSITDPYSSHGRRRTWLRS